MTMLFVHAGGTFDIGGAYEEELKKMGGILFLYNIGLIIFCTVSGTAAALTYKKTHKRFYMYLTLLPVCFIAELIVLHYISSEVYFKGQAVDSSTLNHISFIFVRIICYMLILLLDFLILLWILQVPWKFQYLLLFLPALVFYVALAFPKQSNLVVWLFYSVRQFYRFAFLLFFAYRYFTARDETVKMRLNPFTSFMTGILFLNCSVLIEDTLMISHLGSVLFDTPWMSERNFSENLMWVFICLCSLRVCTRELLELDVTREALETPAAEEDAFVPRPEVSQPEADLPVQTVNARSADANPLLGNIPAFVEYYKLTPREEEILGYLIECRHTSEICEELSISTGTVKTHIHNIYMKLEVNTQAELMRELSEFTVKVPDNG